MILLDNETRIDLLNNEPMASAIVELLLKKQGHPITIGVHGDWGAGKSSILEMVEHCFSQQNRDDVLCIKFNGWRFQGFEDAKIALIESILSELKKKRPITEKTQGLFRDLISRVDGLKFAKKSIGWAAAIYSGLPVGGAVESMISGVSKLFKDNSSPSKEDVVSAIETAGDLLKTPENKNIPDEISEFHNAFSKLLEQSGITQLIILVDDLDRCLPETAIETLEAIRLFLFTKNTAFIVAADEGMIEYAVKKHFPDLPESNGSQTYARHYLEKLIQVPFRIPALGEAETRIYVTLLLMGEYLGESDPKFLSLISLARSKLQKPWIAEAFDFDAVKTVVGDDSKALAVLRLSGQVGPLLAAGTKGNPRQIKRFINTMILRQSVAMARGFADEIKQPILAKLMLVEQFHPNAFSDIVENVSKSSDGKCSLFGLLEQQTPPKISEKPIKKSETDTEDQGDGNSSLVLKKWETESLISWVNIEPALSDVDLRPYLFVAKEKNDYLGKSTSSGRLDIVYAALFGNEMQIASLSDSIKSLSQSDALSVFKRVETKIFAGDSFANAPEGVHGLRLLMRLHESLRESYLSFLEMLPENLVGAWALKNMELLDSDHALSTRLDALKNKWLTNGSKTMKAALNASTTKRRS